MKLSKHSADLPNSRRTTVSSCPIESRQHINYPKRIPFQRYLEELVNPKIKNDQPQLIKREQPDYLKAPRINENPFRYVRFERISQLKEREIERKDDDARRYAKAHGLCEKLPLHVRQVNTAASNVRKLIHEENMKEIMHFGRLYGPNNLTAQPVNSRFCKTKPANTRQHSLAQTVSLRGIEDGTDLKLFGEEAKSSDVESDSRELISRNDIERGSNRVPAEMDSDEISIRGQPQCSRGTKLHEDLTTFVQDRRRVCLLELAMRAKRGEVRRLDTMLKAENDFLKREELEVLKRHEEHDRYLKSVCQRTAEAIRLAEGEARKRNEITDRIKRARYRLAHLNAECVKLEEEYIRLRTYKEFLRKVANTFHEHHTAPVQVVDFSVDGFESVGSDGMPSFSFDGIGRVSDGVHSNPVVRLVSRISSQVSEDNASLIEFFSSPQDLVDILSELESNNLTLIENVQEQEEVCERVRAKANRLHRLLNAEREMVDLHIEREKQNISGIRENVTQIRLSRETLTDFTLLERYVKVFHLGDVEQFENLESAFMITGQATSPGSPVSGQPARNTAVGKMAKQRLSPETLDVKPTISTLLSILQVQIQRVYSAVYGIIEGGARLDTLVMLRRLETTVDELSEMLNAYPKNLVIKAKRTVDERNRVNARRRQKVEGRLAYERRLKKAILKAREGPRWRRGRRVLERSRPPEIKKELTVGEEKVQVEEDNRSLFTA